MATKTVKFNNQQYNGESSFTAFLVSLADGSIGNGAGDAVTAGSNGSFSFDVTEAITGWWAVVIKKSGVTYLEGGRVYFESDTAGDYLVDDPGAMWNLQLLDYVSSGSMGEAVGLILTAVNLLVVRIPSTLFSGITYLSRWLGAIAGKTADTTTRAEINLTTAGAGYNETTDSLEALRDRGDAAWITGGGNGDGARTVLVTVTDGTNPLENARVRFTSGAETYIDNTDENGEVVFNLDDLTWDVAITKSGYDFDQIGDTLVVDGDETPTYTMTAQTVTPSDPPYITGRYIALDSNHVPVSGVVFSFFVAKQTSLDGYGQKNNVRTTTSGSGGVASFTNLLPGTTYKIKRGAGEWYTVKVPDDQTETLDLDSLIGP